MFQIALMDFMQTAMKGTMANIGITTVPKSRLDALLERATAANTSRKEQLEVRDYRIAQMFTIKKHQTA